MGVKAAWALKGGALSQEYVVGHAIEPNFAVSDDYGSDIGRLPGMYTWREVYWIVGKAGGSAIECGGFPGEAVCCVAVASGVE